MPYNRYALRRIRRTAWFLNGWMIMIVTDLYHFYVSHQSGLTLGFFVVYASPPGSILTFPVYGVFVTI